MISELEIKEQKIRSFLRDHQDYIISSLSLDKIVKLYDKITEGATLSETSHWVIKTWLPEDANKFKSIVSELASFKLEVLKPSEIVKIQAERNNDPESIVLTKAKETLSASLDGMGRLGWLINVQTDRVSKLTNKEGNLPLDVTNNAIRQLGVLLEKYISFQKDGGVETCINVDQSIKIDSRVNTFLEHSIHNSADDMALAAARLIENAKQKAVSMDLDKAGRYVFSTLPDLETEETSLVCKEELKIGQG